MDGHQVVAAGMAVTSHPPHRPVLAELPRTVLTSDVPPHGGWREIARLEIHEQLSERVAIDRIGCAVSANQSDIKSSGTCNVWGVSKKFCN